MRPPDLYESTHFVLDARGRILSTREPTPAPGPLFSLTRGAEHVAWSVHANVPDSVANELTALARSEAPTVEPRAVPEHDVRYLALLGPLASGRALAVHHGPALEFPERISTPSGVVEISDERALARHFRGWAPGEIASGRAPAFAVFDAEHAVSVCFCARRSEIAAEAGVDTTPQFRGRGLAGLVVAAWALAVRASGRTPLYSTAWENAASLAVAGKLGLVAYASHWRVSAAAR